MGTRSWRGCSPCRWCLGVGTDEGRVGNDVTKYLYNHLNVVPVNVENRSEFPDYPRRWFLIVSDDDQILGDGPTEAVAKSDAELRRQPGVPSPKAQALLRKQRRELRRRRQQRYEKLRDL